MAMSLDNKSLLMEVQKRIAVLEEAIHQVGTTKKHLKQNAMEAKGDIHTAMSRQLERLRSREIWLLNQVDLVQQAKEEVLQCQEERLHQALGGLQDIMEVGSELATAAGDDHIHETLGRLNMMDLRPEETPHISFHGNPAALTEETQKFGQVDPKGLPATMVFPGRELGAASLPPAVEEYDEDEEHHLLYKTVENVTEEPEKRTRQITINFPRLSQSPKDWLFLPTDVPPPTSPRPEEKFSFPPFLSSNVKGWLSTHGQSMMTTSSSQASIEQWLCDIHNQAVIEEEEGDIDFEMVPGCNFLTADSAAASSSIEVLSIGDIHAQVLQAENQDAAIHFPRDLQHGYFRDVQGSQMSDWLLDGDAIRAKHDFGASYPYQTMKYFREISQNTKHWLLQYQQRETDDQMEVELCKPDCCNSGSCSSGTATPIEPVDIENLDQLVCIQDSVSKYFKEVSCDSSQWLLKKKDEDLDLDELEMVEHERVNVTKVCRANEKCDSFAECLSDEICCSRVPKNVSAMEVKALEASPMFEYFRKASKSSSDWLLRPAKESSVPTKKKKVPTATLR